MNDEDLVSAFSNSPQENGRPLWMSPYSRMTNVVLLHWYPLGIYFQLIILNDFKLITIKI